MVDEYQDDPSIPDNAGLWRRIPPAYICYDEKLGRWRPESWAFSDDEDGDPMSVFVDSECPGLQAVLVHHEGYGVAAITAALARQMGQIIFRRADAAEPGHVFVYGEKTRAVMRTSARNCTWVHLPPRH